MSQESENEESLFESEENQEFSFEDFSLNDRLLQNIKELKFLQPTTIQSMVIPHYLSGKDLIALAKTGSGKTGAFVIPLWESWLRYNEKKLMNSQETQHHDIGQDQESHFKIAPFALILSPTRELAQQTQLLVDQLAKGLIDNTSQSKQISSALLIGGEGLDAQERNLQANPVVIVATPGRCKDFINQGKLDLKNVKQFIFDEADRLFDMGFSKDIDFILRAGPDPKTLDENNIRQLVMFSATGNQDVMMLAHAHGADPLGISASEDTLHVENINHQVAMLSSHEKMGYLVHLLQNMPDAYAIIFCNTQIMTHSLAQWLNKCGFKSQAISGRLAQNRRTRLMEEFRSKVVNILVCTDVAARGLDISDVNLVVNYELPNEAANYVHRIGRTGRAGKNGLAISFCAFEDCESLEEIHKFLGRSIPKREILESEFVKNLPAKPYLDSKTLKEIPKNRNTRHEKHSSSGINKGGNKMDFHENKNKKTKNDFAERNLKNSESRNQTSQKETSIKGEETNLNLKSKVKDFTSYNLKDAQLKAQNFFKLNDLSLLKLVKEVSGRRKYFLFGPKLTTYSFEVEIHFRKLLLPFLIELFRKMGFKIYLQVLYRPGQVTVTLSGENKSQIDVVLRDLKIALTQIMCVYLERYFRVPRELKFHFEAERGFARSSQSSREGDLRTRDLNDEKMLANLRPRLEKLKISGDDVVLNSLNPAQRRLVHQLVEEIGDLKSESIGDGRFKDLKVSRLH